MRAVSWNVDGLRACMGHGMCDALASQDADVITLQETKVNEPVFAAELAGYHAFWCFAGRRGYSGVLVLSRAEPERVLHGLGDDGFDVEGRVVTLQFPEAYVVCLYAPNPMRSRTRAAYREKWDRLLCSWAARLAADRPVLMLGDFNVAHTDDDIFAGSTDRLKETSGFSPSVRAGMDRLLECGMRDVYRELHPGEAAGFSWWGPRLNGAREDNKGRRLDYALVSDDLMGKVTSCELLADVPGSDHCPVAIDVDIELTGSLRARVPRGKAGRAALRRVAGGENALLHALPRRDYATAWKSVNWGETEARVARMQDAIARAEAERDWEAAADARDELTSSLDARLLAVRHVGSGRSGPGPDGVKWLRPEEKMEAVLSLDARGYKPSPSRAVSLETPAKRRQVHVMTCYDRAMQYVMKLALDPVAEARADWHSFAFRRGRSQMDANECLVAALSGKDAPGWVLVTDVEQCYHSVSHNWVLAHVPADRRLLSDFLEAGYIMDGRLFPTNQGVNLGHSLAPTVANMAMDGLERHLKGGLFAEDPDAWRGCEYLRYADDIVVTARSAAAAYDAAGVIERFLSDRGMKLSESKTRVEEVEGGFEFMSRRYERRGEGMWVFPARAAVERFKETLRETVEGHTGTQEELIKSLNRKLDGFSTYHKSTDCTDAFREVDAYLKGMLLANLQERHPGWPRGKVIGRYFVELPDGRRAFALRERPDVRVRFLADTVCVAHKLCDCRRNPYVIDGEGRLADATARANATGRYRAVWEAQGGRCANCGSPILRDDEKRIIKVERPHAAPQLAYVHERCMDVAVEAYAVECLPYTAIDTMELLEDIDSGRHARKYGALAAWMRKFDKPTERVKFSEIETVLGFPLPPSSSKEAFWRNTGFGRISGAWTVNGYELADVDCEKGVLTLRRAGRRTSAVVIPKPILEGRVPESCKYEIENFLQGMVRKYGLK